MRELPFARRIRDLKESGTLKVLDKVKELQAQGVNIIQLDVGEPDMKTPQNIIDAAEMALAAGFTHYTPSAGIPELREAIAKKLASENGIEASKENVIVTPGSKQALFYSIMALVDEGDEVLIPTPAWPSYMEMVALAGGKVREISSLQDFSLDIEGLKEAINSRTKMIILNTPNNPTGHVCRKEEIVGIAELASDKGITIVSDEIYEKLIYEGSHLSIGSLEAVRDMVITINGFSKAYAMTGWRIGYAAAPKAIASAMNKLQQHSASSPASFSQKAAIEALNPKTPIRPMVEEFRRRRDYICRALDGMGIFKFKKPRGAFYLFPNISRTSMTGSELSNLLLEAGVSTTAGDSFGGYSRNIRISYANSMENLIEATQRIQRILGKKKLI
jgi:aspartate aminotransferase